MSRVSNNDATPMNGGLEIKKEVYSKDYKMDDAMTGSIEVTQDVDSYITQTNFKTLNQDLKTFRSLLDAQATAIEQNSADIKALSLQVKVKKAEVFAAMEAKIDYLNSYWFEQRVDIMCTALGANEVMKDTLAEVMQGYKNVASELSADFKTLAVLEDNADVFHKLDSRIEVYKKDLLNSESYKAFAEEKQLSSSNYVTALGTGKNVSVVVEDEPEVAVVSEAVMDVIMGKTKVNFNEAEFSDELSEKGDLVSADSIFTTYVDNIKMRYTIVHQPKKVLNTIIDQHIKTIKKTLKNMVFPQRFQYHSLQSQSSMITSLNWFEEFMDYLDNYHDSKHRIVGLLFAQSEYLYDADAVQTNDRRAEYLTLLAKYFGEDLSVPDLYEIFEGVAFEIIPAILAKLSFPQEYLSDPKFYEKFRGSFYDNKSNFLSKKKSSIFYSYVHRLSVVASKNGAPEFESFTPMVQELKANFSLLQKKDSLKQFYVTNPTTDYELAHNKRIMKKSKVEKFIFDSFVEQLKSFSIYLLLARILGSTDVSKNIESFAKNYEYFYLKTEFYSSMMQLYYSSLQALNSGTKISKKKPINYYKNILSTIGDVECQDIAELKLVAQGYDLEQIVKDCSKKSPSGTLYHTQFNRVFIEMKSKDDFTNFVLSLLKKKGYPVNKLQDISPEETKKLIAKAKKAASKI